MTPALSTEWRQGRPGKRPPADIVSIGDSTYELRIAAVPSPTANGHPNSLAAPTALEQLSSPERLGRPSGPASPPVLIHQSYLARVSSSVGLPASRSALSEKLASDYRAAWIERELAQPGAQQGAADLANVLEWDPDMLNDHVLGCLQARKSALLGLQHFADGMLPERSINRRNMLPLRNKLRDDLAHHIGVLRLATLDLGEAIHAWEKNAG